MDKPKMGMKAPASDTYLYRGAPVLLAYKKAYNGQITRLRLLVRSLETNKKHTAAGVVMAELRENQQERDGWERLDKLRQELHSEAYAFLAAMEHELHNSTPAILPDVEIVPIQPRQHIASRVCHRRWGTCRDGQKHHCRGSVSVTGECESLCKCSECGEASA